MVRVRIDKELKKIFGKENIFCGGEKNGEGKGGKILAKWDLKSQTLVGPGF